MRIVTGQQVLLMPEGGGEVLARATVTRLGPQLSNRVLNLNGARVRADGRVRAAWATLDDSDTRLLVIGQQLEAKVVVAQRQVAAMVPRGAVHVTEGRAVVDLIWGPVVHEVPVQIHGSDDSAVEVRGLRPGQIVLLR